MSTDNAKSPSFQGCNHTSWKSCLACHINNTAKHHIPYPYAPVTATVRCPTRVSNNSCARHKLPAILSSNLTIPATALHAPQAKPLLATNSQGLHTLQLQVLKHPSKGMPCHSRAAAVHRRCSCRGGQWRSIMLLHPHQCILPLATIAHQLRRSSQSHGCSAAAAAASGVAWCCCITICA